jgi:glycine betaine/proline transport system substrate-binding protein
MQQSGVMGEDILPGIDEDFLEDVFQDFSVRQWIAKDTYFLIKAEMDMTLELTPAAMGFPEEEGLVTMDIKMDMLAYDYNQPVSIELPQEAEEATREPLAFADLDWDSVQVHNRIAAFILEHGYGYNIAYNFGSTIPMFVGLTNGSNDISMEIWVENQQAAYDEAIAAGTILDLGSNYPDSWQGWLVPTYMITDGDLPADISVADMPDYWELFKDPDDPTKGRFYSCIIGWECEIINDTKFDVYGLKDTYNVFSPGNATALLSSMAAAYEKHEPWFGYYWEPTAALGMYDMTKIEEPPYDETIWNTNHGCAYPPINVKICVTTSLLDRAPEAVEFLRNYETTATMINKALAYMETNEAKAEEAAIWFLQEYESVWTQWVSLDVADKVKTALVEY